jgi:hypothetical protein
MSMEMLASYCNSTKYHNPEDLNLNRNWCENLKSLKTYDIWNFSPKYKVANIQIFFPSERALKAVWILFTVL